jgi:hypothetical protein
VFPPFVPAVPVAVTVIGYDPVGVPGIGVTVTGGLLLLPPQPTIIRTIPIASTPRTIPIRRLRFQLPARINPKIPTLLRLASSMLPCAGVRLAEIGAVVCKLNVVVIGVLPFGVNVGLLNAHVVFEGNPAHVNVTVPL